MRVTELWIYPIKGCRGTPLDTSAVDHLGLAGDRRLMLVDRQNRFISQREAPMLATVSPHLAGARLTVHGRQCRPLQFDLDAGGSRREVFVWGKSPITATDQGDVAARWFASIIGLACRLVHFGDDAHHLVDANFTSRAGAETAFTDGYPILGVLQESLDDLNRRLSAPVPMARFRPSVVIKGAAAWSEDGWSGIALGALPVDAVKPCARCIVSTTDQRSGARDPEQEPLRTLATFHTVAPFGAIFGQNLVPRTTGELHVGDPVHPL
jgi:uncharacterized protein YcbX